MKKLWYEKYRPTAWEDYVWIDDEFREKIERWKADPGKTPHMCLVGPPGTGKTTLAQLLAASMTTDENDVLFIHSSMNNGAEMVRGDIRPFCEVAGWSELKFVILDEAERLSLDAQEMLRNIINQYGDFVRFIFTCNSTTKLNQFMDSRIRTFHFDGLDRDQFMERILTILVTEEVELDDTAVSIVQKVIDAHYPDMRKTIDMLEDCCVDGKLVESKRATTVERPWMRGLITHLETKFDIKTLRDSINEVPLDQLPEIYLEVDRRAGEVFGPNEGLAVVVVKNHMVQHAQAAFPQLWVLGMFIELHYLKAEA